MSSTVTFRKISMNDAAMMHQWRNHPNVRAVSFQKEEIPFEQHKKWLESALKNKKQLLLLGILTGEAIGVVRFDLINASIAEISIYLDPVKVGKGLGSPLLKNSIIYLKKIWPEIKKVKAEILPENEPSLRLFTRAGFKPVETYFELVLK